MAFGSPGAYPLPAAGGPQHNKFREMRPDWSAVTHRHQYEDGGASFIAFNDTGPIYFVIEYTGLSVAAAALIYTHRNDAGGEMFGFNLTNPQTATVFTGVHYAPDGWEEDHTKTHITKLRIRLVRYPA